MHKGHRPTVPSDCPRRLPGGGPLEVRPAPGGVCYAFAARPSRGPPKIRITYEGAAWERSEAAVGADASRIGLPASEPACYNELPWGKLSVESFPQTPFKDF